MQTVIDGRGLTVSLVSRHVVFEANLADLTPRGRLIVDTMAPVLREIDDDLAIEGHTNQAPGAPKYFASDWDLSAARAVTVLRHLNEQRGIPAERLSAVGFGKVRPLVDPSEPGSQQLNKRVDIVVLSGLAEENRELLDRVMYDRTRPRRSTTRPDRRPAPSRPTPRSSAQGRSHHDDHHPPPPRQAPGEVQVITKGGGRKKVILMIVVAAPGDRRRGVLVRAQAGRGQGAPKPGEVVRLEPIQVNLAGGHYLKIGIALQLTADAHEADGSKALDATIDLFSGRSMDAADPRRDTARS